jgi:amino acid adenylation domain-containing protein
MTTFTVCSTIPQTVAERVFETPDATAVRARSKRMSYWELNERANRLARHLRSLGVEKGSLVAVCLPRSVEMAVGMLAIWKAGGVYLPMDPTNPPDRLASILEDAQVRVVVSTPEISPRIAKTGCVLAYAGMPDPTSEGPSQELAFETEPDDLAYVIYTSGSTGVPKGVEITHGSLANLVTWHQEAFAVNPADRASHLAGLAFDAAGWELWPYLAAGASVHLVDDIIRNSEELLQRWLLEERITISFVPTPLAERLLALDWPKPTALRLLLTGGDTLHHYPPAGLPFEVVNNYGPTECTVVATSAPVPPVRGATPLPPIGRAISNTEIYLVDDNLKAVAPGTPGEICIAGFSLARGYRNLPNLTAEKFVENPFGPGGRMYRTGDVGMLLPDGQIEYLGRLDDQIKIRGYRIEPNEIISRLNQHPDVRESLVVAREDVRGEKRLVAYVVLRSDGATADAGLIEFLRAAVPDYMLPSAFVRMKALPLTSNGKIDRSALPAPDFGSRGDLEGPQTAVEQSIGGMLAELLKVPGVGRNENFFLLGGHSLLGAQLIARLRKVFGVEISLRALFEAPTIAALAVEIETRTAVSQPELSSASGRP